MQVFPIFLYLQNGLYIYFFFNHLHTLAAEVGPQWIWLLGLLR